MKLSRRNTTRIPSGEKAGWLVRSEKSRKRSEHAGRLCFPGSLFLSLACSGRKPPRMRLIAITPTKIDTPARTPRCTHRGSLSARTVSASRLGNRSDDFRLPMRPLPVRTPDGDEIIAGNLRRQLQTLQTFSSSAFAGGVIAPPAAAVSIAFSTVAINRYPRPWKRLNISGIFGGIAQTHHAVLFTGRIQPVIEIHKRVARPTTRPAAPLVSPAVRGRLINSARISKRLSHQLDSSSMFPQLVRMQVGLISAETQTIWADDLHHLGPTLIPRYTIRTYRGSTKPHGMNILTDDLRCAQKMRWIALW